MPGFWIFFYQELWLSFCWVFRLGDEMDVLFVGGFGYLNWEFVWIEILGI